MDKASTPKAALRTSSGKKGAKKGAIGQATEGKNGTARRSERARVREVTVPTTMRLRVSQKECAEQIAEQMGVKRSQLDPTFYMTGALLTGVERLGKSEQIGTWSREEVAVYLKGMLTPLFELLYEQDELPLVFSLLLSRGVALSSAPSLEPGQLGMRVREVDTAQGDITSTTSSVSVKGKGSKTRIAREVPREEATSDVSDGYIPELGADAEVGLDGFPGGI
jgi:hypothetical protein